MTKRTMIFRGFGVLSVGVVLAADGSPAEANVLGGSVEVLAAGPGQTTGPSGPQAAAPTPATPASPPSSFVCKVISTSASAASPTEETFGLSACTPPLPAGFVVIAAGAPQAILSLAFANGASVTLDGSPIGPWKTLQLKSVSMSSPR